MRNNKQALLNLLTVISILCILLFVSMVNFKIWRAQHPNAPTWVFFIIKK